MHRVAVVSGLKLMPPRYDDDCDGRFSTRDGSIGALLNPGAGVSSPPMLLGALPFVLYLQALRENPAAVARRGLLVSSLSLSSCCRSAAHHVLDINLGRALREAAFNVTSSWRTGLAASSIAGWGSFASGCSFSSCSSAALQGRPHDRKIFHYRDPVSDGEGQMTPDPSAWDIHQHLQRPADYREVKIQS